MRHSLVPNDKASLSHRDSASTLSYVITRWERVGSKLARSADTGKVLVKDLVEARDHPEATILVVVIEQVQDTLQSHTITSHNLITHEKRINIELSNTKDGFQARE
jgi:hypothetical protein